MLQDADEDEELSGKVAFNRMTEAADSIRLQEPQDYLLKLVQAAVAGGCSTLRITTHGHDVELSFDGLPWSPAEMLRLFPALVRSPKSMPRHLRHLAVGLAAAGRAGVKTWELRSTSSRMRLLERSIVIDSEGAEQNVVVLHGQAAATRSFAWVLSLLFEPGLDSFLGQRAGFAPIPILVNGAPVNRHPGFEIGKISPTLSLKPFRVALSEATEVDGFALFIARGSSAPSLHTGDPGFGVAARMSGNGLGWLSGVWHRKDTWKRVEATVVKPPFGLGFSQSRVELPGHQLPTLFYAGAPLLRATAAIQISPRTSHDSATLRLIEDGVGWEVEHPEELPSGYRFWISTSAVPDEPLEPDAGYFRVNQAQEGYTRLLRQLGRMLAKAWPELSSGTRSLSE